MNLPSCTDPLLLRTVFHSLRDKEADLLSLFSLPRETALSFLSDLSSIEEGSSYRSLSRARAIAAALITDKGEFDAGQAARLLLALKEGHIFYPGGQESGYHYLVRALEQWQAPELAQTLKRFSLPVIHTSAEALVCHTLGLAVQTPLSDALLRQAVLCACLTPLRQSVGSCFATAPALLVQQDNPLLLLSDLHQLLFTGKLQRTFGGYQYAVPLSPTTGAGGLLKIVTGSAHYSPALLAACQVFDPALSKEALEQRIERLCPLTAKKSVEECIQAVGLDVCGLSLQDLSAFVLWEKTQVRHFARGSISAAPDKMSQSQRFVSLQTRALETFKAHSANALLKAWEYTIASFSEVKQEFSQWNFYISLGFESQEPGGIGAFLLERINEKLNEINKELQKHQREYELAFDQLRSVEVLLRNAGSEAEGRRLRAEHQSRLYHLRACQEQRDTLHEHGTHYSQLLPFLLKQYATLFTSHFQEIYDAKMQELSEVLYQDSPAGFRLVYKQGRTDPSTWTLIHSAQEYVDSLTDFFSQTLPEILSSVSWEGAEEAIRDLTTQLIHFIGQPSFIAAAIARMTSAHYARGFAEDRIEKKPWAYVSGGTMSTLLKTYYRKEGEFHTESKWVQTPQELLIFLIDTLKTLPDSLLTPYLKGKRTGMLMHSPSHAFSLMPLQLKAGWQEELFTYTWVRDVIIEPGRSFYASIRLGAREQQLLFDLWCSEHQLQSGSLHLEGAISVGAWRKEALALTSHSPGTIDAFLYRHLPLVSGHDWKARAALFLRPLLGEDSLRVLEHYPDQPVSWFTAQQWRDLIQALVLTHLQQTLLPFDLEQRVIALSQELGLASPSLLLFADTNWEGYYFTFLINPGTLELELWRTNRACSRGMPMTEWNRYFSKTDKQQWTLYTHAHEYL